MLVLSITLALADIAPSPSRPDWDDPPAPLPPPPTLLIVTALTLGGFGAAWATHRGRATT